jgi:transcriptional regulator with XRE-family HTH domain
LLGEESMVQRRGFRPDLFRQVRERLYPSQQAFAVALTKRFGRRLGQSHISAIERGVNQPSVEMLTAFAEMLNVTPDHLLGFDDQASHRLQDLTALLATLPETDLELVWNLARRLTGERTRQENEWLSLWRNVAQIGGEKMIRQFERVLGIAAPVEIRSGENEAGQRSIDQPAKPVNGGLPVGG